MARLLAEGGTNFDLTNGLYLIGRGEPDPDDPPKVDVGPLYGGMTVSRHHADIRQVAGQWYLRVSRDARNPTLVGERRVPGGEEVLLVDGSRIRLGTVVLLFRSDQEPSGTDPDGRGASPSLVRVPPPLIPSVIPSPRAITWPARLPVGPATLSTLGAEELKRVNPFPGLMVDASTWSDAHDYHRHLAQLHLMSGHGWGILEGLEVVADVREPGVLVVRPGLAVDPQGRVLVVNRQQPLPRIDSTSGRFYVGLRWQEDLAVPQRAWSDAEQFTRVVERGVITIDPGPIESPSLELARIELSGPIRNALSPTSPQPGEIDFRFRERLAIQPRPNLVVAQVVVTPGDSPEHSADVVHQVGLRFLLREINQTTSYRARWGGTIRLDAPLPDVSLLYLTGDGGFTIPDAGLAAIQTYLNNGGVVLADACQNGQFPEFIASVQQLAETLGRPLRPVGRWHPLLTARHVFGSSPLEGFLGDGLSEGQGIILSTADCGCIWRGGTDRNPLPRDVVRVALEIGVNAAMYARQRQFPIEAIDLEV